MKTIEDHTCQFCDSFYKLSFDERKCSGFSKFCPFCGSELAEGDEIEDLEE
jgi:hypothetical protein